MSEPSAADQDSGVPEPTRWERVEALFDRALDLSPDEREAFLAEACGDDQELRREVAELLAADAGATAAFTPPSRATMGRLFDEVDDDQAVGRRVGVWTLERPLGAGGMGKVYLARRSDGEFDMAAAVKLVRPGLATDDVLARFRHERATLARLEHPNIARLLDGGATDEGLPFLVMEYVPGHSLDRWCDARQLDVEARLRLMLPILDAVATAHRQAIVHRDLKPANVLVDAAGTPRLLDFGIAKVLDAPEDDVATTRPGERPMTPAYASPEQVRGEAVGTASDVWSLGVMLCELLTGRLPFDGAVQSVETAILEQDAPRLSRLALRDEDGARRRPGETVETWTLGTGTTEVEGGSDRSRPGAGSRSDSIRSGDGSSSDVSRSDSSRSGDDPPDSSRTDRGSPGHPGGLGPPSADAGGGRAGPAEGPGAQRLSPHARRAADRGSTPQGLARRLAGDLDAIVHQALQRDVSRRYASVDQLREDIERHLAGLPVSARPDDTLYRCGLFVRRHRLAVGAALLILGALAVSVVTYVRSTEVVRTTLEDMGRLSDARRLTLIEERMDGLWPPAPETQAPIRAWLTDARALVAGLGRHRATRDALTERLAAERAGTLEVDPSLTGDTAWWLGLQEDLVQRLEAFASGPPHGRTLAAMERRLEWCERVATLSLADPDWPEAIATIADVTRCPAYEGLEITVQRFLAPLGVDPQSGLYEFWHVLTGERPERGADGRWRMDGDSAIVFVLLPPVQGALVGAQSMSATSAHFDAAASAVEQPVFPYTLGAHFLARYELTQGQWLRLAGDNPSEYHPRHGTWPTDLSHPVERVSYDVGARVLVRHGMRLPTEVQWERAARAGTSTPWITGNDPAGLDRVANLADLYARDHGGSEGWSYGPAAAHGLDDGHAIHAPVGSFEPNAFGLHDMHGNVWEWCADHLVPYTITIRAVDALRMPPPEAPLDGRRIYRGGGYGNPPNSLRSSNRMAAASDERGRWLGLRPAMHLELPADGADGG